MHNPGTSHFLPRVKNFERTDISFDISKIYLQLQLL